MWYEILPSTLAMLTFLTIPGIVIIRDHKYNNGGKERRVALSKWQWFLLERDRRVSGTGRYYESKGLENIN